MPRTPARIMIILGLLLALGGAVLAGSAAVGATGGNDNGTPNGGGHIAVPVCHWVPAHGGSYVFIEPDDDGAYGGHHEQHEHDIIPAPAEGCPTGATATAAPATNTPPPATHTATATNTSEASTPTATKTNTPFGATTTPTATNTNTPVGATTTPTATNTNTPLAATNTPSATNTNTPVGATHTPTATNTGEATHTPTATDTPGGGESADTATPTRTSTAEASETTEPTASATATHTPSGAVAGVSTGPRGLPSAGSGGHGTSALVAVGIAMAALGAGTVMLGTRRRA